MIMKPVTSSQIASIGHDAETETLHVRFADRTNRKTGAVIPGALYAYDSVPAHVHSALMAADADPAVGVGTHFRAHIKNGGYSYRKIES